MSDSYQDQSKQLFLSVQSEICSKLEQLDGTAKFNLDDWKRPDIAGGYGGGGKTRVLAGGDVFERAGVNFSAVSGHLPIEMSKTLVDLDDKAPFFATGISLVIHPRSPLVPTTHANYRYLEVADKKWFGGGADLTPYYLYEEDTCHFHRVLKTECDKHNHDYYPKFKKWCDEYFYLPHRQETRGVGGLFFDYLGKDRPEDLPHYFEFVSDLAVSFLNSYTPIVERRKEQPYTNAQRDFQLIRRGRYVEFNLLYDRGTQFGLKTGGRTESILMSLPAEVRWVYDYNPEPGSPEEQLIETLKNPQDWV